MKIIKIIIAYLVLTSFVKADWNSSRTFYNYNRQSTYYNYNPQPEQSSYFSNYREYNSYPIYTRSNIFGGSNYYQRDVIIQSRPNIFGTNNFYKVR